MSGEFGAYLPVLIQLLLAAIMGAAILFVSEVFGQRTKPNAIKDSAYECGNIPFTGPHPRFSVKFYVTAMLFILFDIEVVFLVPWVLIYREFLAAGVPILMPILVFLLVLVVGLVYELKKGALEWER